MNLSKSKALRFFYNIPGVASAYHFLWAWGSAKLYRNPGEKIFVIGVTGTKGKTTTVELLNAILEAAGRKTALLSSLRVKIGDTTRRNPTGNSMPGHGFIQKFLADAVRGGCEFAIIEVTSQGVVMHRHRFAEWDMAAWTNIAPEHIESHGSFENYRQAKLDFLRYVADGGGKVFLNSDDKNFPFYRDALAHDRPANASAGDAAVAEHMRALKASAAKKKEEDKKFLLSDFNAENIAVAVLIAHELGIADEAVRKGLLAFEGVPGRAEFIVKGAYTAVVDYAHTPDSLEAVYKAVKPKKGKLIAVLGAAGGGRDRWKRSEMGAVAARYADHIILSDEDPYDEDPEEIVREIASGILKTGPKNKFEVVLDRTAAIDRAVSLMKAGDVVIGTGKGSEDAIHGPGGTRIPWNERRAFEKALDAKRKPSR